MSRLDEIDQELDGVRTFGFDTLLTGGYFADDAIASKIHRKADRMFIGDAVKNAGMKANSNLSANTDWVSNIEGSSYWFMRTAQLAVQHTQGMWAVLGASRNSDGVAGEELAIGVGGIVVNDVAGKSAWGLYSDLTHETGATGTYGLEVAAKNKGADVFSNPGNVSGGVIGLWIVAGGDNSYGGVSSNPSNVALAVKDGSNTWNTGVMFGEDSLTAGQAMALSSVGTGGSHYLMWYNASGQQVFSIRSDATDADHWQILRKNGLLQFTENNLEVATFRGVASAVNYLDLQNSATGNPPILSALGDNTDIDLALTPKGTGVVQFGTFTGSADVAVTGSILINDSGGTPRKVAVVA